MYRVAAKVAQKVGMLFEHEHFHALAREQEPEHHPGRPASGNAAAYRKAFGHAFNTP
jgi:hypothetical protein